MTGSPAMAATAVAVMARTSEMAWMATTTDINSN